jgi:hypothetical protein
MNSYIIYIINIHMYVWKHEKYVYWMCAYQRLQGGAKIFNYVKSGFQYNFNNNKFTQASPNLIKVHKVVS